MTTFEEFKIKYINSNKKYDIKNTFIKTYENC